MELINKKDAVHAVLHNRGDAAVAAVQNIKPVDAVPVVRCKDCIEYRDSVGACHYFNYEPTDEMDFCSHGIRADGERRTE